MKKRIGWAWIGLVAWATAAGAFPTAIQQQGRLLDGTNLYNGTATIAYRLYATDAGGAALAGATNSVPVVDGLYAAELDLAPAIWTAVLTNAELYLETEIDGTPLAPRERLGAVAYARLAAGVTNGAIGELQLANGAVTEDKLGSEAVTEKKIGTGAVTEDKLDAGAVTATKIGLGAVALEKLGGNSVNSAKIVDGSITADDVAANTFWQTEGNTGVAGGAFLGTTDGTSFEIRCGNLPVFQASLNGLGTSASLCLGYSNQLATSPGAVIGGGTGNEIGVNCYNDVLAGGSGNTVQGEAQSCVLGGGAYNLIRSNALSATVAGGLWNTIGLGVAYGVVSGGRNNSVTATNGAIGGGASNDVAGARSVVSGGFRNRALAADVAIGGGTENVATNTASRGVIGGGQNNLVSGGGSTIAGGDNNRATAINATVGGGNGNLASAIIATIGGGINNQAATESSTVGGGANNYAGGGAGWATVAGGAGNQATGSYATVAGGNDNRATASGFVGGGEDNRMGASSAYGTIAGGQDNYIEAGSTYNAIGGGRGNFITAMYNTIGGGVSNTLFAPYSFIGGGWKNFCQGLYGAIGGGGSNYVDSIYGAIGGGWDNYAAAAAAVGGGISNSAYGNYSAIPGGYSNKSAGAYSLAAGFRASADHDGSFVWSDSSTNEPFGSTAIDQFNVRAANGMRVVGTTNLGLLTVSPLHSGANQDAQIYLTEGETESYGTILKNDGGVNQFQIFGKSGTNVYGPHLVVARDSGLVGIGRTPTTNPLEVEGDASKTVAGSWLANSDARIKTDVRTIEGALETLAKLRPVAFRYTAEHRAKHPSIADRDYNNFIAQEYREVFPDAVKEDGEGLLMVDTYDVQPYLVRAVQELRGMVDDLRSENAALRARLDALEATGR